MNIQLFNINDINTAYYNPRKELQPDDTDYKKIKRSLETFGCVEPIVLNEVNMRCIGGHQRLQVMRDMGYEDIPCSVISIEDEEKEKALNIALNKISGRFDEQKLESLLTEIRDEGFDCTITGFDSEELEEMLSSVDLEDIPTLEEESKAVENIKEQNVVCKIDTTSFKVARDLYIKVLNDIRMNVGFGDGDIINELKRRIADGANS